jgi:phosphate transport system protein
MDRYFDALLSDLKHRLIKMSALADSMIAASIRVLASRDQSAIETLLEHEKQVDLMQVTIDEMCLKLIALYQPAAGDLRFIVGASKTNNELERLADQAVNICDKAVRLLDEPPLMPLPMLSDMATVASAMLKDSLHAYLNRDVRLAHEVLARDDQVDEMKRTVTETLVGVMEKDPTSIRRALSLALIARNLERIGDHATNIAENTIFVAEGKDIRHAAEQEGAGHPGRP